MQRRNQKGFTLMELMVVIVIVAILAAVAVPLYINYVKDAARTEAKGAIGAVITAEQVYFQQKGTYVVDDLTKPTLLNVDLSDVNPRWTMTITNATNDALSINATQAGPGAQTPPLQVNYTYTRSTGVSEWTTETP